MITSVDYKNHDNEYVGALIEIQSESAPLFTPRLHIQDHVLSVVKNYCYVMYAPSTQSEISSKNYSATLLLI